GNTTVWFKRFDAQGAVIVGSLTAVGDPQAFSGSSDPQIAALPDGGFALAYVDTTWPTGSAEISLRLYDADGTPRTNHILVNDGLTTGNQSVPTLTVLSNGFVAVGWNDQSSLNHFERIFDGNGVSLGGGGVTLNAVAGRFAALPGGAF